MSIGTHFIVLVFGTKTNINIYCHHFGDSFLKIILRYQGLS